MGDVARLSHQDKLRRISFFSSLPPDMLSALAARLRHVHYRQGEVVFVEDSVGDSLYFIESGQVKVSVGSGPDERIINYLGPGNFFGELAVLLNQRRTTNVTVVIDADFWVLRKNDLDALLEKYPANAIHISRELSRRLTDTIQRPVREERYNLVAVVGAEPWRLAARVTRLSGEKIALLDVAEANLAERVSETLPDNIVLHAASPFLTEQETVETLAVLADTRDRVLVNISPEQRDASAKAMQLAKVTVLIDVEERSWMSDSASGPIWQITGTEQEIDRAARRLAQRVVGLALSSGGGTWYCAR